MNYFREIFRGEIPSKLTKTNSGKSRQGLSEPGLGPKGANLAKKKDPLVAISALSPWL